MRSARFPASSQAASFIVAATRGAFRSREIWQLRIVSASGQNSSKVHLLLLAGCFFDNPPETTTQVKYLRRDHLFEVRANSAQPRTFVCGNPMRPDGQLDKNSASNWDALQFNRSIRFADRNNSRSETRRRDVYSRVYSRARARVPGRDDLGAAELFKPATRGISDPFNQDANVRFFERHTRDRNARLQDSALEFPRTARLAAAGSSSAIPRYHQTSMARIRCPFDETRDVPKRASSSQRAIRGADRFVDAGIGEFDPMK